MSNTKKTSLEKALLEAREIENAAIESAKKIVEESAISKIEDAVKATLEEIEKESLNEGVSIDVGGADVSIDVEGGSTSINVDADEDDLVITPDEDEDDEEVEGEDEEGEEGEEDEEGEEETEEEELFEINLFEEEEAPVAEAPAEEAPAEEAPADEDMEMGAAEGGSMTVEVPTASAIEDLSSKLDAILSKLEAPAEAVEAAEEVPATEEGGEEVAPEGEVPVEAEEETIEITDEAPADEEVVSEDNTVFELYEDDTLSEIDIVDEEEEFDILDVLAAEEEDEALEDMGIELDEDDNIEEVMGVGHGVQRAFGNKTKDNGHHAPVSPVHENKAHKEAKIAELEKENESLRESLKEYKESFKVLRKQINEVQTFNAKLAYVNKLFSKGGLTNDEKVQIAESFDGVETVEEAKTLYNKIISENKSFSSSKTEQLKSKLKSTSPNVATSTKSEALYESKEISRMKQLAGIRTLNS